MLPYHHTIFKFRQSGKLKIEGGYTFASLIVKIVLDEYAPFENLFVIILSIPRLIVTSFVPHT